MGFEYALVHLYYNIPPAIILTFIYRPFFTRLDAYRILFLITIAVTATTPWDSYLIRTKVWTYPSHVIIGPTLFGIPLEEVFFFVIQTYNTSLLYLLLCIPTFRPVFLRHETKSDPWRYYKLFGTLASALMFKKSISMLKAGKEGTYMGLILVWALPFVCLLWNLAYQFIIGLPISETLLPIAIPTGYLWIVDTLALQRGTWVIENGTKLNIQLWDGLEIEEAIFFLLTNTMIVFGLIAFDNAIAILDAFPDRFQNTPSLPSPVLLVKALLLPAASYDQERLLGLRQATSRLQKKSRSFHLASATFDRRLRIDLTILYSFCRIADDLIDAATSAEARENVAKLRHFLDLSYSKDPLARSSARDYVQRSFPLDAQLGILQLVTERLPSQPLYGLLKGFETDLQFDTVKTRASPFPISSEQDLDTYGERVAGTVAVLCLELVFYHLPSDLSEKQRSALRRAGTNMGTGLQYVNIARDLETDAQAQRMYIPTDWLAEHKMTPQEAIDVLATRTGVSSDKRRVLEMLRKRLLSRAFALYEDAAPAINGLPPGARAAMRVAVESYMEIGRVLQEGNHVVQHGRATVPLLRRLRVAYRALTRA